MFSVQTRKVAESVEYSESKSMVVIGNKAQPAQNGEMFKFNYFFCIPQQMAHYIMLIMEIEYDL